MILKVTAITTAVSLGIFGISKNFEVGLGWLISLFVLYFIVQRIDRSKPYGNSKRVGMMLGIGISLVVASWLWQSV